MAMAMMASQGTPNSEPLPMKSNGRSGLNTVVSLPSRRATPRMAVSEPSVTMKGGSFSQAMMAPLRKPQARPAAIAAGTPSMPRSGTSETMTAIMAEAARMEPTERSMPPVRMTKVMPAASTVLIDACCMTIDRLLTERNRPLST